LPLSYLLLGAAVLAAWTPASIANGMAARWRWQVLLAASLVAALAEGQMTWIGALPVVALWAVATVYLSAPSNRWRAWCAWLAALLAVAMATHRLPGFNPLLIADA